MDMFVVPFLLAANVPPNADRLPLCLESTFNVHVNTRLTIANGSIGNFFHSNFTSKLICSATARNKLICYINKPHLLITSSSVSTTTPIIGELAETRHFIPFDFINSAPIELVFDTFGIVNYSIPEYKYPSTYFLELFLTITNQMNIGDWEKWGQGSTCGWDFTYIGNCSTNYTVYYRFEMSKPATAKYRFNLKSISDLELEDNQAILIKKQRYLDKCQSFNDYMFGIKNINTSFPVYHKMIDSTTRIQLSIQKFSTSTDYKYKLYNQNEKEIGSATENVYLQLDTI